MIKYESTLLTFTEIPDEISLCFNITNCPCRCKECFEPWLREDIGEELTLDRVVYEINKSFNAPTCICFMGGDNDHIHLAALCCNIKRKYPNIKLAMYSGFQEIDELLALYLDYYKVGPYIPERGPLNNPNTNQRMYKKVTKEDHCTWQFEDITYKFQQLKQ